MSFDPDKLWAFVKQWSVGRLVALLVLVGWIFSCEKEKIINSVFALLIIAVLLEVFELSANALRMHETTAHDQPELRNSGARICFIITMLAAVFGLLAIAGCFLFC